MICGLDGDMEGHHIYPCIHICTSELQSVCMLQGELPDNPIVNFTAHTLLSGAAAAALIQKTRPELVGQADLVVNLGDMTIEGLPTGFLSG